ncbi:MAG TPA: secretin N-terminal domain-containing protein, partial [Pirellulales bacterium]|nr:secretin N-terminal domain-containing protein [Pirellulales bacterium]
ESGQQRLVREFRLRHTRADDVIEKLQTLLGVDSQSDPAQAMMAQMMAQQSGDRGDRGGRSRRDRDRGGSEGDRGPQAFAASPPKAEFYLAVNARTNSILVNAPPDKMATIEQAIAVIDVAQQRDASPLDHLPRVQTYRLGGISPETLVKVLTELGGLDATARLEVDAQHGAIIAYAPLADQMLIRTLVEMLDGKGRRFEVIQLRTLGAEFVAGSIQTLLAAPEKSDDSRRRSYDGGSGQQDEPDRFQVEADTEHNRLLLRATEAELAEVRSLLVKLGEIPSGERNASTVRMIPAPSGAETDRLLERIERLWPALGPNPLEVEPAEDKPAHDGPPAASARPAPAEENVPNSPKPDEKGEQGEQGVEPGAETYLPANPRGRSARPPFRFAQESRVSAESPQDSAESPQDSADEGPPVDPQPPMDFPGRELPRAAHAPVKITVGPYGLVISSSDAQALDRLEELIGNFMPARLTYKVFTIKNTYAKDLALLLEDIYKNEDAASSSSMDPFGGSRRSRSRGQSSEPPRSTLSSRRPLKFVPDAVTNTILVQGADANQLAEIESLIKLYDGDDVPDANSVRRTELVSLRYAKAVDVAEVVKDVYRDLLSPNDKALQRGQGQPQQQREGGSHSSFSYLTDDVEKSANIPKFKGMLSVGIDERANGLAVSAPQILLADVLEMVDQLDQAAKPLRAVVRVQKLRQPLSASQIERALGPKKGESPATPSAEAAAKPPETSPSSGRRREAEASAN